VNQAFAILSDPSGRVYAPGDLVLSTDPVVKGHEAYFEPVEAAAARRSPLEQATAPPGQRRSIGSRVSRKPKKAPAAKAAEPKPEPPATDNDGTADDPTPTTPKDAS